MRTGRVIAVVLGLLAGTLPSAAHASPDPNLKIDSVTLNKATVSVSGLNTVPVTVTVKGSYTSSLPADQTMPVNVFLERTAGAGRTTVLVSTNLVRNQQAGTWTGPLNVPSTADGRFTVTGVMTGPYFPGGGTMTDPTPYAGPSISVTGTHIPKITAVVTPKVVPFNSGYSIRWAVTDSQSGKPYGSRLKVALANDNGCVEYRGPGYSNLTDTNGVVTKSYPASAGGYLNCLLLPGNPAANGWLSLFVARPGIVSAAPTKTSAPVGTIVPVNGSVAGAPYRCPVHLQRLYGATQWRTVGSSTVRSSGRFSLSAQPAYKGLIPYRVYFPRCNVFMAGVSRTFSIRGT